MTITTIKPEIPRDRWQRPLVVPPNGGKALAYTRCTTYIDVLDDKFNLNQWSQRMVALGLASRPDLLLSVSAHRDDKKALNKICEDAREAAAASAAATTGTALHALTEVLDRGQTMPVIPATATASLDAYAAATADLKATHIEQFCVQDWLKVGGTPDRVVKYGKGAKAKSYIADIKTGSIEWGALKIAMQLAVYARSHTYDHVTHERGMHGADLERGLIIHLPAVDDPSEARCELYWIDLLAGWRAVQVAKEVREQRTHKFADLCEPFRTVDLTPALEASIEAAAETPRSTDADEGGVLETVIAKATSADAIRDLWAANADIWTPHLTEVAKDRIESLGTTSDAVA